MTMEKIVPSTSPPRQHGYEKDDENVPSTRLQPVAVSKESVLDVPVDEGLGPDEDGITYRYLTFETEIPFDTSLESTPNLKKYESPLKWSSTRKTVILIISCMCTLSAGYSAGPYSIASQPQREKWHLSSLAFTCGLTTWAIGFACSPMFLAPFSEINGRRPVFIGSAILFLIGQIVCGATDSFAVMLVFRFFVGAGASTFATMVGGVVSDMYAAEERNTPMAIYSGAALTASGLGPMVSGFIVSRVNYRWVYYHQAIFLAIITVLVFFFFNETRGSVLLSRRAKVLNQYLASLDTHDTTVDSSTSTSTSTPTSQPAPPPAPLSRIRFKVAADETRSSLTTMLYLSLTIPFKLLATEPVVFFFSLWASFAWAILYMTFGVIPLVFRTRHDFNIQQTGAVFAAISIGTIITTILSIYQEHLAKRLWPKLSESPEGRLYFACLESALLPIGLFWFGWTTSSSIPWISPVLALGCAQMGIFVIYLAVFNYLADVYHRYASSALAAQSCCRNLMAAVFALFTDQMFRKLGYAQACSLLGAIGALLTVVPWVLVFNGEKVRARSKIASEIMVMDG